MKRKLGRKKNHTDEVFKESLQQYQAAPPGGVWKGVTESLDADKRKVRMAWMTRIAAAAVIVVAAGTAWLWVQRSGSNEIGRVDSIENQKVFQETPGEVPQEPSQEGPQKVPEKVLQEVPQEGPQNLSLDRHHGVSKEVLQEGPQDLSRERPQGVSQDGIQEVSRELSRERPQGVRTVASGERRDDLTASQSYGQQGPYFGEEMRMGSITRYNIPVEYPQEGIIQAMHTGGDKAPPAGNPLTLEETGSGEGIDVFEEFGEEGSRDYAKWAVGGQVTPLYSYRNVESASYDYSAIAPAYAGYSSNTSYTGSYDDFESGILSYAGGVNVNYSPARRLSFQSGIYYSRMGMSITNGYVAILDGQDKIAPPTFSQQMQVANSTGQINQDRYKENSIVSNIAPPDQRDAETDFNAGPVPSPVILEGDVLQQFEYIEIPLVARYRVVDRRLGLNLLGGLSTNFLVGNSVYFEEGSNKEYIGTTEDIKPVNYSSVLGLGLQYSLSRKLHINMEPTFRYYLNSVNTGSGPGSHPYSLGFFTGISYSF